MSDETDLPLEQLARYAQDLRTAMERERTRREELNLAEGQLEVYAQDLAQIVAACRKLESSLGGLESSVPRMLQRALELRDPQLAAHGRRVGRYAKQIAGWLDRPSWEIESIEAAAALHDLGQLALSDSILFVPELPADAPAAVRSHPAHGAAVLGEGRSELLGMAREIALGHHERWDGSGYPHGLMGAKIPISARIVALADAYDTLRARRCFKPPLAHHECVRAVLEGNGPVQPDHFDPELLELFTGQHEELDEIAEEIARELA